MDTVVFQDVSYKSCQQLFDAHKAGLRTNGEAPFATDGFNKAWEALGGKIVKSEPDANGEYSVGYFLEDGMTLGFQAEMTFGDSHNI